MTTHDDPSRAAARVAWLQQIDGCLQRGDYARAQALLAEAERLLPGDAELAKRQQVIAIASRFDDGGGDRTLVRPQRRAGAPARPADTGATQIVPGRRPAPASMPAPMPPPSEAPTVVMSRPVLPSVPPLQPVDSNPLLSDDPAFAAPPPPVPPAVTTPASRLAPRTPPASKTRAPWVIPAIVAAAVILAGTLVVFLLSSEESGPPPVVAGREPAAPPPAPPPAPVVTPAPLLPPTQSLPDTTVGSGAGTTSDNLARPGSDSGARSRGATGRSPTETTQPATGRVTLRGFEPGTTVLIDGQSVGTIGQNRSLERTGLSAGRHTIVLERAGFRPLQIVRDVAAGSVLNLTSADHPFERLPVMVPFRAAADVEFTVVSGGTRVGAGRGPATLPLVEGRYDVISTGPAGVALTETIAVGPGDPQPVDVRSIGGMERFAGWSAEGGWHTRTGGGIVLYDRTDADGTFSFTVRLDRDGNPFSSARRLGWIVAFIDDRNYVSFELDRENFYLSEVLNGRRSDELRTRHGIPTGGASIRMQVDVSNSRIIHRYSVDGQSWRTFHDWNQLKLRNRRFGFNIERNERVAISDFQFRPRPR